MRVLGILCVLMVAILAGCDDDQSTDTSKGDENRTVMGANYWWAGHNANVKAAYTRIAPSGLASQHEFTIQLQLFYF